MAGTEYSAIEKAYLRLLMPLADLIGKSYAAKRLQTLFPGRSLDSIAQNLQRLGRTEGWECKYDLRRQKGFTQEERDAHESLAKSIESEAKRVAEGFAEFKKRDPIQDEQSSFEGDTWDLAAKTHERITTLEHLVEFCKIDLETWEIERWVCNKWEVGAKNAHKEIEVTPLFQIKAFLRRRTEYIACKQHLEWLIEEAKAHAPVYFELKRDHKTDGHLAIINLTDIHFGKLCWAEEVGNDYDLKIAESIWHEAIDDLLHKLGAYPLALIQLVIGHDLFNSDNIVGTTTAGTPQDNDGRFHKVYRRVIGVLIETIDKCLLRAPVSILFVPGNHDTLSCFTAGIAIECWYRNATEVTIDNSANKRKYFEWGSNMFCHMHGSKIKPAQLPLTMASEQPEMWGRTTYREVQTGDKHHYTSEDVMGTQVFKLPSLAGTDAYHHDNLFIGSRRSGIARVFHPTDGPVAQLMFNLKPRRIA